ncbi:MAG TPA: type II secretion system F family protein [Candidatus Deferrimicrobiaceae bacterium]|nr:type II secretion system F family protein [Candidatus Deferrimicrobiaceae bacterium]
MTVFSYRAADRRGQTIDGVMEAADARAVVERLQREAYFPIAIAAQDQRRRVFGLAWPETGRERVAGRDLVSFTQQLATLVEAGLPLDRALAIQAELAPTARLRAITADVLRGVRGGSSLADALGAHHPRPFSRLYVNMVRAGEKGGVLETTLRRLAGFLEESQEFRDALVSALIYPVLLTGVGAGAVVFLMAFVIPRFAVIFDDLGATIPLPTLILLEASAAIHRYWWLLALLGVGGVLAGRMVLATPRGRLGADRLLLRLPLAGEVIVKSEVARFTRILGTLLRSGVAMIPALTVVRDMLGNQVLARAVEGLGDGVRRGAGLAQPMAEARAFPPLAVHMVRVGEETGRLEETLLQVAASLETDTRKLVKRLIALAEPCIILVMGVVVGFIVVAMLLAILSVTDLPL